MNRSERKFIRTSNGFHFVKTVVCFSLNKDLYKQFNYIRKKHKLSVTQFIKEALDVFYCPVKLKEPIFIDSFEMKTKYTNKDYKFTSAFLDFETIQKIKYLANSFDIGKSAVVAILIRKYLELL
jgi:hypothetical protein